MSIIKAVEFPNKEFTSKDELFKALKEHKVALVDKKKSALKYSDGLPSRGVQIKSLEANKNFDMDSNYVYAVINTTKYMDSHNDVHANGIWNQSVKQQQGKIYYVADHSMEIDQIIAYPKDVEMMIEDISWSTVGADFEGETQALIYKVAKDKIRKANVQEIISEKIDIEHSVRMQYVDVELAVNSEDADFSEEKARFDANIDGIANKEHAQEVGYFWIVREAKVYKEGSMVSLGSNDLTPMLLSKEDIEPSPDTHTQEPSPDTRKDSEPKVGADKLNNIFI